MSEEENIKDAFLEGLFSARSRGGWMDVYCHRMFHNCGINSGNAQFQIKSYLEEENKKYDQTGSLPDFLDIQRFLNSMAFVFKGSSIFLLKPKTGVGLQEEILNEKNDSNKVHEGPRKRRKNKIKGIQSADDSLRTRHQNNGNPDGRNLRGKGGKTKTHQLRRRSVSKQIILPELDDTRATR